MLSKDGDVAGWGLDLETRRLRPLGVFGYVREKKLRVRWEYSTTIHRDETMDSFAEALRETLEYLIQNH